MESITIGQISKIFVFLVGLIGAIEYLSLRLKKWLKVTLKDEFEPLKQDINCLKEMQDNETLNRCKSDLITLMSRIQNGYIPTSEEKRILIETKDLYNSKGGDSYVDDMFDNLKKKGMI